MKHKTEIVKIITDMSGKYSAGTIFSDWVQCTALAIQNACQLIHNQLWHEREQEYISIMDKYSQKEQLQMSHMFHLLSCAFEDEMADLMGEIYMEAKCGNKHTGQFFTPFHLSCLTAGLVSADVSEENPLILNEPSAGSGGMIIAEALELKKRGINYQKCMKVNARDLDWRCVYMAYVQLSLLGIDATVMQGDSLTNEKTEPKQIFKTPNRMGALLL